MQNETIVDRVVARLKSQPLGDLITEEDLHDIVKQAIPKTFFEKRSIKLDQWGRTEDKEPIIIEIMRDLLKDAASSAVEKYILENYEVINNYWKEVLDTGLLNYIQELQNIKATSMTAQALNNMLNAVNDTREKLGLPRIYL